MTASALEALPPELLTHLLSFLDLDELLSLSTTSHHLHHVVAASYIAHFARASLGYAPRTLKHLSFHARAPWPVRARWAARVAQRWDAWDARGGVVSAWREKCLPVVRLWEPARGVGAVLAARGREVEMWLTRQDGTVEPVPVVIADPWTHRARRGGDARGAHDDVTALAATQTPGEVLVSRVSGQVQRLAVVQHASARDGMPVVLEERARYSCGPEVGGAQTTVQALHAQGNVLVSAATSRLRAAAAAASTAVASTPGAGAVGRVTSLAQSLSSRAAPKRHFVSLHSLSSPWESPVVLPFAHKPWSVHLSPSARWLAVGHNGTTPLSIFHLDSTGAPASSGDAQVLARTKRNTSVYGLASPSPSCSPLNAEQTLLAAFYDSTTRVYDLRVPGPSSAVASAWTDSDEQRPQNEVMRLVDPWSDDPCYSVAMGGAAGAYVAVGTARNAAVRLFDVRYASSTMRQQGGKGKGQVAGRRGGITAFAPGRDRSPVYGLEIEGSRVWGVTDRRGFVLDFDAFRPRGGRAGIGEKVAFVGHGEGEGGVLRWTGDDEQR